MRVTNQMFYTNMRYDYKNSMGGLYNASKQLSSGLKIQYGYEDTSTFIDTLRLDYNITTLDQVKSSSSKAQTFANNADKVLNQVTDTFAAFKTKLIQAANSGASSTTSMEALANDLEALRSSMIAQVNTSINGQFLFSGTALTKKPMDELGNYHGNDETIKTVAGAKVQLPYNISGFDLMLSNDRDYQDIQQTNVRLTNQIEPDKGKPLKENNTIHQMVGEFTGDTTFYLQGRKTTGESLKEKFSLTPDSKISDLLDIIGKKYGNTEDNELVNLSMNKDGHIIVKDNQKGNSLLEFHLIAATGDNSSVDDPTNITAGANTKIIEFIKTNQTDIDGNKINPSNYNKVAFDKSGNTTKGSVSQVVQGTNNFASNSTKLKDVAGSSLVGEVFNLDIKDINGTTKNIVINLDANNSTFEVDGDTYTIFDGDGNQTKADEFSYRQLNDIISMSSSGNLPATTNDPNDYNNAIVTSKNLVEVNLDYRGKIEVVDVMNSKSKIEVSLYGENANDFTKAPSKLSFSANEALVVDEPYVDIFKDLDEMIKAVRGELNEADGDFEDPKNPGIEAALKRLDHLSDHIIKRHAKIGSYSNALKSTSERAELLSLNIKKIQSEVIDADYGETYMKLNQNSMSYQAILQATAKINSLSLLNYM